MAGSEQAPRFRGVIFDFDGTIADTLPVCIEAFQATFDQHDGPKLDDEGVRALFGPTEEGVLLTALGPAADGALDTYLREYRRLHSSITAPFAGMGDLLEALANRSIPMAIVTGKGQGSIDISLEVLGLSTFFDPVLAGSPERSIKSQAMTAVAAAWDMAPGAILSVGDHITDIRHGRMAGTHPVGAAWAHPDSAGLLAAEAPEAVFVEVAEFSDWTLARV